MLGAHSGLRLVQPVLLLGCVAAKRSLKSVAGGVWDRSQALHTSSRAPCWQQPALATRLGDQGGVQCVGPAPQ